MHYTNYVQYRKVKRPIGAYFSYLTHSVLAATPTLTASSTAQLANWAASFWECSHIRLAFKRSSAQQQHRPSIINHKSVFDFSKTLLTPKCYMYVIQYMYVMYFSCSQTLRNAFCHIPQKIVIDTHCSWSCGWHISILLTNKALCISGIASQKRIHTSRCLHEGAIIF